MKNLTLKSLLALLFIVAIPATKISAQFVTLTAATATSIAPGGTVTFNVDRGSNNTNWPGGTSSWTYNFSSAPSAGVSFSPATVVSGSRPINNATVVTFANAGTFVISCSVSEAGGLQNQLSNTVTVTVTAPTPAVTLSPSTSQSIAAGGNVSFTVTASNFGGSGNYTYTWNAAGATIPGSNPNTIAGATDTKALTFSSAGTYTVNVTVARTGATTRTTSTVTVTVVAPPPAPSLWASSSNGTQISSYTVANGVYFSGPTNIFAPTFPGTTTGGTTTAAIGRNNIPSAANGFFYWLPNTSNNAGTVEVFAATAVGGTPTRIGSVDVNGASNNSLGFVRLGMGPDGSGWILAGDNTTLYLATFMSNGVNPVTITTKPITLSGGAVSTFQNGDVCVSGNNNLYALANDGAGVTQIFIGSLSNPTVSLVKKWDLVDPANAPFTGSVNGVAFDAVGSLYITTAAGLYFINQATVNGPAGTVECSLVQAQTGLQDLASNVFPQQSTLPITLGDFTISKQGSNAQLIWTTLTETNTDHFDIERSSDGVNFVKAGSKTSNANSTAIRNYQYLDPITVNSGILYYRLKTVDQDGKFTYSKIVSLRISGGAVRDMVIYPNPFSDNLKIQMTTDHATMVTIRINNAAGQLVVNRTFSLQNGENTIVLSSELQNLKPGMHLMEIITEEGKTTQKIIKR